MTAMLDSEADEQGPCDEQSGIAADHCKVALLDPRAWGPGDAASPPGTAAGAACSRPIWRRLVAVGLAAGVVAALAGQVSAGSYRSRQAASTTTSLVLESSAESSYLAFSWRIDPEQPFFVKPAKEIFDERPSDVNRKEFDTVTSVTVSSSSSHEFASEVSSRLGVNRSFQAFTVAASSSSSSIFPAEVRALRVDNYIIAKQSLISTNLPDQSARMKKSFKDFVLEGTVKQVHDFMGDFYATEITLGGVFQMTTLLAQGQHDRRERLESQVASEGVRLLRAAKAGWGHSSSSPVMVAGRQAWTRLQVLGGEAALWLRLEMGGRNEQQVQREWAGSITRENQFPVEYRLEPLWQLFEGDPDLKGKAQELKRHMLGEWAKAAAKVHGVGRPLRPAAAAASTSRRPSTAAPPRRPPASLLLSGCGTHAVNGRYARWDSGSCEPGANYCPMYGHAGSGPKYRLYHYGPWAGLPQGWYIGKGLKYGSYFAPGDQHSVPSAGWRVFTGQFSDPGLAPVPRVSAQGR